MAKLQTILANLHSRVKRKVIILDIRISRPRRNRFRHPDPFSIEGIEAEKANAARAGEIDWEVPVIDEEALDRLTTMFTIYPK